MVEIGRDGDITARGLVGRSEFSAADAAAGQAFLAKVADVVTTYKLEADADLDWRYRIRAGNEGPRVGALSRNLTYDLWEILSNRNQKNSHMQDKSLDRDTVACRLAEDLIGPRAEDEELTARPSDLYLTGILWPQRTAMSGEDDERLGTAGAGSGEASDGENDAVRTGSTQKNGKRLRYYISHRLVTDRREKHADAWRLPARHLGTGIARVLGDHLRKPIVVTDLVRDITASEVPDLQATLRQVANDCDPEGEAAAENRIAPNAKQRLGPFWATISPIISSL